MIPASAPTTKPKARMLSEIQATRDRKDSQKTGVGLRPDRPLGQQEKSLAACATRLLIWLAEALEVPLAHLYCEDDGIAALLLALHQLPVRERAKRVEQFAQALAAGAA